jgi:hypothetical protein
MDPGDPTPARCTIGETATAPTDENCRNVEVYNAVYAALLGEMIGDLSIID